MKSADYRCPECKQIITKRIETKNSFPKYVLCLKCGNDATRIFTPIYSICHQGRMGNSKNGYTSSPVSIKKT